MMLKAVVSRGKFRFAQFSVCLWSDWRRNAWPTGVDACDRNAGHDDCYRSAPVPLTDCMGPSNCIRPAGDLDTKNAEPVG
jgi:hypothetical protein